MYIFLQSDLLRPVWHLDVGDPVQMGLGPVRLSAVAVTMTEKEGQQNLSGYSKRLDRVFPAAGQVTHGFIFR